MRQPIDHEWLFPGNKTYNRVLGSTFDPMGALVRGNMPGAKDVFYISRPGGELLPSRSGVYAFTVANSRTDAQRAMYVGETHRFDYRMGNYNIFDATMPSPASFVRSISSTDIRVTEHISRTLSGGSNVFLWFAPAAKLEKSHFDCALSLERRLLELHADQLEWNDTKIGRSCLCAICTIVLIRKAVEADLGTSDSELIRYIRETLAKSEDKLPREV